MRDFVDKWGRQKKGKPWFPLSILYFVYGKSDRWRGRERKEP
jgi:hypothetical protein